MSLRELQPLMPSFTTAGVKSFLHLIEDRDFRPGDKAAPQKLCYSHRSPVIPKADLGTGQVASQFSQGTSLGER